MVIDPVRPSDLWELGGPMDDPLVATQESESPLMAHVQLEDIMFSGARELKLRAPEHQVLAASLADEPLYASIERPTGKVLVLTVDLDEGELPLRTAFPIMMTNAMVWFQGPRGQLRESLCTGRVVEVDLGPRQPSTTLASVKPDSGLATRRPSGLCLRRPNGDVTDLPADVDRVTIGPLDQCGVWRVEPASPSSGRPPAALAELACNLANAEESDLSRPSIDSPAPAGVRWRGGRSSWFYLAAAALVLTTIEWYLYQRRWIS
jgi:hypothetical protein